MVQSSDYKVTKGGYMQSQDGQNLSCFSNLSIASDKRVNPFSAAFNESEVKSNVLL